MGSPNDPDRSRSAGEAPSCAYTCNEIVAMSPVKMVRKRPGMYVGDVHDGTGQMHLLREVIANVVDEHLAGHARRLSVVLEGSRLTIDDDGRGIHPDVVPIALTKMHYRGTYDGHFRHVHLAGFGLGLCPVAAVCDHFEVEIFRDGERHRMQMVRGETTESLRYLGATSRRGTRIRYEPDPSIFTSRPYDPVEVEALMWDVACCNPALEVSFQGRRLQAQCGGADDVRRRGAVPTVAVRGQVCDVGVDVVLGWRDEGSPDVRSFVSQMPTREGAHLNGLWAALLDTAREHVSPAVGRELLERGLVGWVHVTLYDPRFGPPTRERITNPEVRSAVQELVSRHLHFPAAIRARLEDPASASRLREL